MTNVEVSLTNFRRSRSDNNGRGSSRGETVGFFHGGALFAKVSPRT